MRFPWYVASAISVLSFLFLIVMIFFALFLTGSDPQADPLSALGPIVWATIASGAIVSIEAPLLARSRKVLALFFTWLVIAALVAGMVACPL